MVNDRRAKKRNDLTELMWQGNILFSKWISNNVKTVSKTAKQTDKNNGEGSQPESICNDRKT